MTLGNSLSEIDWGNKTIQLVAVGSGVVIFTAIMVSRSNKAKLAAASAAQQAAVPVNYVAYGTTDRTPVGVIGWLGDEGGPIQPPGLDEKTLRLNLLKRRADELAHLIQTYMALLAKARKGKRKEYQTNIAGSRAELEGVKTEIESLGGTYEPPAGVLPPPPTDNSARCTELAASIAGHKTDITNLRQQMSACQNNQCTNAHKRDIAKEQAEMAKDVHEQRTLHCGSGTAGMGAGTHPHRLLMTMGRMAPSGGVPAYRQYYGYGKVGAAPVSMPAPVNYGVDFLGEGETLKQFARRTQGDEFYWPNIASKNRLTTVPRAGTALAI